MAIARAPQHRPSAWLRWLLGAVLLVLLLAALAIGAWHWAARRPLPVVHGTLQLPALGAPVEVLRDDLGVPALYGVSSADVYRAQGYVHAQDRFWQMDVWRHSGTGRAAELLGRAHLPADRLIRTLGWEQLAREELALLRPESRDILVAYAEGVNAYLAGRAVGQLSLEHALASIGRRLSAPEPWEPFHSLAILRLSAWDASANLEHELEQLAGHPIPEAVGAALRPCYPDDAPLITRPGEGDLPGTAGTAAPSCDSIAATAGHTRRIPLDGAAKGFAAIRSTTEGRGFGVGSNSWVLGGSWTASGAPILANDPHLGVQIPSAWYQMSLRCSLPSPRCDTQVTGFTLAGLPGVLIGHNGEVAWGFTNSLVDVMDLVIEELNPDDPTQYRDGRSWADLEVHEEHLTSSDGASETIEVRRTRRGPVISHLRGGQDDGTPAGVHHGVVVALRWTGHDPQPAFDALPALNRAQDGGDVRRAAARFTIAAQNLLYADSAGSIGYQATGRVPARSAGAGEGEDEWQGLIPFEELPAVVDPDAGYLVTANNAIVDASYPYVLGQDFDMGYRAARIQQLIEGGSRSVTTREAQAWQRDLADGSTAWLLPALTSVRTDDARARIAQDVLGDWSGTATAGSAAAAVYAVTWRHLLVTTFGEGVPEELLPSGSSRWFEVVRHLLRNEHSPWWDDAATEAVEGRDEALTTAMALAVEELSDRFGEDPSRWRWGQLHQLTFRHREVGDVPWLRSAFARGPYPVGGGVLTVDAHAWHAARGYEVVAVPSLRMVVDLGDLEASVGVQATGQSGHAGHADYASMIPRWLGDDPPPLRWSREEVAAAARHRLLLEP